MKKQPKIKQRVMLAVVGREGVPVMVPFYQTKNDVEYECNENVGETVQRVLVTAPPKRRKRK